jgi:hypothetical protein
MERGTKMTFDPSTAKLEFDPLSASEVGAEVKPVTISSVEDIATAMDPSFIKKLVSGIKNKGKSLSDIISSENTFKGPGAYLSNLSKIITEDVPEEAKGAWERTNTRFNNLSLPTVAEEKFKGPIDKAIVGAPEDVAREFGSVIGTAAEVPGVAVSLGGKAINRLAGNVPGIIAGEGVKKLSGVSEPVSKWWNGLSDAERANFTAALDISNVFGMKAPKAIGEGLENTGKAALGNQLKIKDIAAKRAYGSPRLDISKKKILDNIAKYDLESVKNDFGGMADKALSEAKKASTQADNILNNIASKPTAPRGQFVDDIIEKAWEDLPELTAVGKEPGAFSTINDIIEGSYTRGLSGTEKKGLEELIKFKRKLDPQDNLFTLGPAPSDADAIDRKIRKELYLRTMDKINEFSPKAGALNKKAKELFDIAGVAGDAASRTANQNAMFTLSNTLIGGTGGGSALTSLAFQKPGAALGALAGTAGLLGAKTAAGQGRGPAGLIELGKLISNISPAVSTGVTSNLERPALSTTVPDILKGFSEERSQSRKKPGAAYDYSDIENTRNKYRESLKNTLDVPDSAIEQILNRLFPR